MEQFNKALSFVLGLIVVAVFIVFASGKINLKNLTLPKGKTVTKATLSPTPSAVPAQNQTVSKTENADYHPYVTSVPTKKIATIPSSIPNTGVPIVMFPALISSLATGMFLRSSGKKKD